MTELRVDIDAWEHPGLPHIRQRHSSAMNTKADRAPAAVQAERAKESQFGKTQERVGVMEVAIQLS